MAGQFILKTVSPEVVTGNRQPLYIGGTDSLGTDGVIVVGADGIARIGEQPIANSSVVQLKNWIINGMFDVWQRGTSQTSDGYGSDDRWRNSNYLSTKTHSRQSFSVGQTDVPNNPTYFSRSIVTTASTVDEMVRKSQTIEGVAKLAGKTVTLSFWAKADANKNISIEFIQDFGTGGSAAVIGIGVQKFALTTSWQRFTKTVSIPSASGKTIGANDCLFSLFYFSAGSDWNARTDSLGNQSGTFDIANVCLVEGSVPIECPNEPYAEVLQKCWRYYWKSETFGYAPHCGGFSYNTTNAWGILELPVQMRIAPTSIEYSNINFGSFNSTWYSATNITIGVAGAKTTIINLPSSGLTTNIPYFVANSASGGYIALSAEL